MKEVNREIIDKVRDDVLKSPKPIKIFSRSLHIDIMKLKNEYQMKNQEEVIKFLMDFYNQDMKDYK